VAKLHFLSPLFDELHTEVTKNCKEWEAWINDTGGWPQSMHEKLPPFERLILVRALKPEKLNTAMQAYVRDRMGNRFSQLLVSKLDDFQEGPDTPTIYFASLEQDPLPNLLKLGLVAHPF
jgi:dynein heavy chain